LKEKATMKPVKERKGPAHLGLAFARLKRAMSP